jgi:hypothetical protein
MRIEWYLGNADDHRHWCTTEGHLPNKGLMVYFRDEKMTQIKGEVIDAYPSVGRSEIEINRVPFPDDASDPVERLQFAAEWIEKEFHGVLETIDPATRKFRYATQRGEVIVKTEKR